MNEPGLQDASESVASRAVQGADAELPAEPVLAQTVQGSRSAAWDPHEVWLNRVKRPREASMERHDHQGQDHAPALGRLLPQTGEV